MLGTRPIEKFSLNKRKGFVFHGQCIVGFVGIRRMETCETEKETLICHDTWLWDIWLVPTKLKQLCLCLWWINLIVLLYTHESISFHFGSLIFSSYVKTYQFIECQRDCFDEYELFAHCFFSVLINKVSVWKHITGTCGVMVIILRSRYCDLSSNSDWIWAHLILSECYSPDFPLWLEAWLQKSTLLDLPDIASLSRFLQFEWNFLDNPVTELWWTMPSPFVQQMMQTYTYKTIAKPFDLNK